MNWTAANILYVPRRFPRGLGRRGLPKQKKKKKAAVSRMLPRAPGPRPAFAATQTGPHSSMGNIQDIDAYGMHSSQY